MSNQILKISFIGYGHIAKAIAKSIVGHTCYQLRAAAPSLQIGFDDNHVVTHPNNLAILSDADIVILAVKPAIMQEVLLQIGRTIPPSCLVISVAAGLCLSWLETELPKHPLIRAMPNIATTVRQGATPMIANRFVTKTQKESAARLFACSGMIAWLEDEREIDILTALSGSGPAYIFLFLEAMAHSAERLGLSQDMAKKFALQTMYGATTFAKESRLDFCELREKVTSRGGTTAAALQVFQDQNIDEIIFDAMNAAYVRAQELRDREI